MCRKEKTYLIEYKYCLEETQLENRIYQLENNEVYPDSLRKKHKNS